MVYKDRTTSKKFYTITLLRKWFEWHEEDAWGASRRFPIYAVADGVTLPGIGELVTPRGSKPAAVIFCKRAVRFLERNFEHMSERTVRSAYAWANRFIRKLNTGKRHPLSTVAALVVVKNQYVFGSRITDCGFALLRDGKVIFKTPEYWSRLRKSRRQGYGTLDGTRRFLKYVETYQRPYRKGDRLLLFSDGFEHHFGAKEFRQLFKTGKLVDIRRRIKEADALLVRKNEMKYGKERTLVIAEL